MDVSELTIRLVLLFLPGLLSFYLIVDKLVAHRPFKIHAIVIYSLLLGFSSYAAYYALAQLLRATLVITVPVAFFRTLTDRNSTIDLTEIVYVTALAVPLGLLITYCINRSFLHRFANAVGVSKKFGDLDVWQRVMNSTVDPWVTVRDRELDLMYAGWIEAFSDSTEKDELFLRDVVVYRNSTGDELYRTPALYLPRQRRSMTVEFPRI